jgi:hypothetical protein
VITLGVDLAASPARTGACTIDWASREVQLHDRPLDDETLLTLVAGSDKAGIDVPFGWPDAFVAAVAHHRDAKRWPGDGTPPDAHRRTLRFRRTDLAVAATLGWPLSVSSDLIAVPAMRYAALESQLRDVVEIDRSGITGRVAETYPAGALRVWGLPSTGYKRRAGTAARAVLVAALRDRWAGGLEAPEPFWTRCLGCDDDLDALLCALIARAVTLGATTAPPAADRPVARREGWIHVPTVPLAALLTGTASGPSSG